MQYHEERHPVHLRSIVIWGYTNQQWLWVPLARELKRRHGAAIHLVTTNDASVAFWKRQDVDGVIDSYTTVHHFFLAYGSVDESETVAYERARQHETTYGLLATDALQADRHLGRGFAAAGPGHARSRLSDQATYERSINFFNRAAKFWEEYFDRVAPSLIIGTTSSVLGKLCVAIARHRRIPTRTLFLMYYQSYHGWGVDEYLAVPAIASRYTVMSDAEAAAVVTDDALAAMRRIPFTDAYYRSFARQASLRALVKKAWIQIRHAVYRRVRGVVTMGNYHLGEQLRALARVRADFHRLMRMPLADASALAGMAYVFFPLHVEPESSVGLMSPEMNEQLACIEFLAKNLPAGVRLVVKEHLPAIGRRPRDFYATLFDIPNVIMLSPYAYALDVARGARAVAVITGTLGLESAVLGVPVISFGLHNMYGFLPHVHVVESWTALRPLLAQLCVDHDAGARTQRQRDGRRFLAALQQVGFDFSWSDYASKQRAPATTREVEACYRSLLDSIEMGGASDACADNAQRPVPIAL
ncbi:MAG: hypothetical protein Q7S96_02875 [bacterium]|nr:hypothetical protein [bacterium]